MLRFLVLFFSLQKFQISLIYLLTLFSRFILHSRHKSKTLEIPQNIFLIGIPPYTPEMNPIEQIWREIRTQGFKNEAFSALQKVVDRLADTICNLTTDTVKSITARDWILSTI